ncbi:MAG: Mrp/NBP35 family ATP-binding protein [Acidimicrobiia bacterium]|nr:Mrp/NBP35 family ATP-binding protein [Acidimicrobiia bacterium]
MPDLTPIREAVETVVDPELRSTIGSLGMVDSVEQASAEEDTGPVVVRLALPLGGHPMETELLSRIRLAATNAGASKISVEMRAMTEEERSALGSKMRGQASGEREIALARPGSRTRVIGIASGKGGVGKSSVTVNLALALTEKGHSVGIMDADVWGFSIPKMMGVDRAPSVLEEMLIPPVAHGVATISMDFFVDPEQAVVWRGPMLHKALEQFLVDVYWGDIDFLLIDMPPGTGDVSISIAQYLPRSEIIVVTTPQPAAQRVAVKAGLMAAKVNQEVVGVVENMSWFTGDDGTRYELFGSGGGEQLASDLDVPFLGQVPFVPELREGGDVGQPIVIADPDSEATKAFAAIADELVARKPRLRSHPELVIS